jgi:hypothetical protein
LEKRVAELEALVKELMSRLNSNSNNSHKPPSSDPPSSRPGTSRPRAKSKGGKHRPGVARELLPPESVTQFIPLHPSFCRHCGLDLQKVSPSKTRISQQLDLPPRVKLIVREFHRHVVSCPHCAKETTADFPPEFSSGLIGDRLASFISTLRPKYHLSVRLTQQLLLDLFGEEAQLSVGTISNVEAKVSQAASPVYQEAKTSIQHSEAVWADETGWFHPSMRAWLWVATTAMLSVFHISGGRSKKSLKHLIGDFKGFLTSDRWGSYSIHPLQKRQFCFSHLLRDFQKACDRRLGAEELGAWAIKEMKKSVKLWKAYRNQEISQKQLNIAIRPIRSRFKLIVKQGLKSKDKFMRTLCKSLRKNWPAIWTFIRFPDQVEPTNNRAERALRSNVIWRKISQGSKSLNGLDFAQRMMTITASLSMQGRNLMNFLEEMILSFRAGLPPPKLLMASAE